MNIISSIICSSGGMFCFATMDHAFFHLEPYDTEIYIAIEAFEVLFFPFGRTNHYTRRLIPPWSTANPIQV